MEHCFGPVLDMVDTALLAEMLREDVETAPYGLELRLELELRPNKAFGLMNALVPRGS